MPDAVFPLPEFAQRVLRDLVVKSISEELHERGQLRTAIRSYLDVLGSSGNSPSAKTLRVHLREAGYKNGSPECRKAVLYLRAAKSLGWF